MSSASISANTFVILNMYILYKFIHILYLNVFACDFDLVVNLVIL